MQSSSRRAFLAGRRTERSPWETFLARLRRVAEGSVHDFAAEAGSARLVPGHMQDVYRARSLCVEHGITLALDGIPSAARLDDGPVLWVEPGAAMARCERLGPDDPRWFVQPGCLIGELEQAGLPQLPRPAAAPDGGGLAGRPARVRLGLRRYGRQRPGACAGAAGRRHASQSGRFRGGQSQAAGQSACPGHDPPVVRVCLGTGRRGPAGRRLVAWPRYRLDALRPAAGGTLNLAHLLLGHGGALGWVEWLVFDERAGHPVERPYESRYGRRPGPGEAGEAADHAVRTLFDPDGVFPEQGQQFRFLHMIRMRRPPYRRPAQAARMAGSISLLISYVSRLPHHGRILARCGARISRARPSRKISVTPTKQLSNQRDLALAYSPGVAAACEEIVADSHNAFRYTGRGNLVGVITNGTAVLGLGNIGPLASKPVMEGKAVLFKKFSGIDVFDIEINEQDPDKLVDIIAGLEPTFGGINLEDIKAPECFYVEQKLRERMNIPVFHDDQHGTAICVTAAFINGLEVVGKDVSKVKVVVSGAGAAALGCLDLMMDMGLPLEHIWVSDIEGVVYEGRTVLMDEKKARFAQKTDARALDDIIGDADVFLGLSAGGVLKPHMVEKMAERPLVLALANPNPEILPADALAVRPDAVIATGRSDFPIRSTTCCAFRTFSAGRWTWGRPPSRGAWKRPPSWRFLRAGP